MQFGKLPESMLNEIDFSLPAEPAFNATVLKPAAKSKAKVYIGCAKWGRKEWLGKIYPPATKEKDFLEEYVKHYNSIELNATHYQVYKEVTISKWKEKAANKNFLFCPKMYQGVTHFGSLAGKEQLTTSFLQGILAFKEHLGPLFIQLSDRFSPNRKKELFEYLGNLPKDLQFFLEVRHPAWFEKSHAEELFAYLKKLNIGAVITDTAGRRDCAHMYVTVPKVFIRYVGNSLHPTDYSRIDSWVKQCCQWIEAGVQEIYFFMHMHNEATSPELTVYLVDQLNDACGLQLNKPVFCNKQGGLFGD